MSPQRALAAVRHLAPLAPERLVAHVHRRHVIVQVRLLEVTLRTVGAHEGAILVMLRPNVFAEVVLPGKAPIAVGTHVAFAFAVHVPDVGVQVGVGGKFLAAERAGEGLYVGVPFEVILEAGNGGELSVAQRAE